MRNLFLLHLREQRGLTPVKIELITGIPCKRYPSYEKGGEAIGSTDLELLAVLLQVKKEYLESYSQQLEYFSLYRKILERKEERVKELTDALKKKIWRHQIITK